MVHVKISFPGSTHALRLVDLRKRQTIEDTARGFLKLLVMSSCDWLLSCFLPATAVAVSLGYADHFYIVKLRFGLYHDDKCESSERHAPAAPSY